jgi:anaerobic selenocysteine-containing dehydrogenase
MTKQVAFRTCPLCEATCGLQIESDAGTVTRIRGDMDDVFSHGYICPKGSTLKALHEDPDRVRTPLLKVNGEFVPVSWDQAWATIREKLVPIFREHGPDSVGVYNGNPWSHNYEAIIYSQILFNTVGKNCFAAASVDQRPREIVSALHYGVRTAFPVPDIDRTNLLILVGTDPLESNGSLATAPDWPGRLKALKERGGKLIVIDPRRSSTAEIADEHISIIPGSDAALFAGIAHVILSENLVQGSHVLAHVDGLDTVKEALHDFTPERVEKLCGISSDHIRRLARQIAGAEACALHGRIGTCLQDFATVTSWLIDVVNILSGNTDTVGGVMFSRGAAMAMNTGGQSGVGPGFTYGNIRSRVRGIPGAFGQLPTVCMAEEIETPGDGQIRAMVIFSGNPVLSTPDSDRVARAFDSLEFMVAIDMYINESTRHADLILPAPSALERSHYDVSYYQFAIRNIANYSPPVMPLDNELIPEWKLLAAIAGLLMDHPLQENINAMVDSLQDKLIQNLVSRAVESPHSNIHGRDSKEIMSDLSPYNGPERMLDFYLRTGPYGDGFNSRDGVSLQKLMENPHGIDFGPLEQRIPEMLRTKDGRINLATPEIISDLDRLRTRINESSTAEDGLVLIGRRHLRSNNSWQHNIRVLMKGKDRCTLHMHPKDAESRGISHLSNVVVSASGRNLVAVVEITDAVMPGVVSLPHGWGHDLPGVKLAIASVNPGQNVNKLATNEYIDPLSGNPHLNGFPVEVVPYIQQEDSNATA